jgi:hypothetical protein
MFGRPLIYLNSQSESNRPAIRGRRQEQEAVESKNAELRVLLPTAPAYWFYGEVLESYRYSLYFPINCYFRRRRVGHLVLAESRNVTPQKEWKC